MTTRPAALRPRALDRLRARCSSWLLPLCGLVLAAGAEGAPLPGDPNDVHAYADAAACQLGGREDRYLPPGITAPPHPPDNARRKIAVDTPDGRKQIDLRWNLIPVTWNQLEVAWKPDDETLGTGKFTLDGQPPKVNVPEPGPNGPFLDPEGAGLKCDRFPYVAASCIPGQYFSEVSWGGRCKDGGKQGQPCIEHADCPDGSCTGQILWHVLFRRLAAPAMTADPDPAAAKPGDWGDKYIPYYDTVDAVGLKTDTYGVVWLDGVNNAKDPANPANDAKGPDGKPLGPAAGRSFENGFRVGPMPRPGGLRPDRREEGRRATRWFDTTAQMRGQECTVCHATPFNGSDWILRGGNPSRRESLRDRPNDDEKPYWHPGNQVLGFAEKLFFNKVTDRATPPNVLDTSGCTACHSQWMVKSSATPGGETAAAGSVAVARLMTMVHDAHADNPFKALGPPYKALASSFRTDKPQAVFLDKDARRTHKMPLPVREDEVRKWNAAFRDQYNRIACCGAGLGGMAATPPNFDGPAGFDCSQIACAWTDGVTDQPPIRAPKPALYTPWMEASGKVPGGDHVQRVDAPDAPANTRLELVPCPPTIVKADPRDQCYRLVWEDPTGSPFNAPPQFHWVKLQKAVAGLDWTPAERADTAYCGGGRPPLVPISSETQLTDPRLTAGNQWRVRYASAVERLPKCERVLARVCGGWCEQETHLPAPMARQVATEVGTLLALANDGNVTPTMEINRGSFRLNQTTKRYVQTVKVRNKGKESLPAPVSLVLDKLSSNGALVNKTGTTGPGSPFVTVNVGSDALLKPGETASVVLEFTNTSNTRITYEPRVLAGFLCP